MILPLNVFSQDFGEVPSLAETEVVATVTAASDRASPDSVVDKNPPADQNYYRLKQSSPESDDMYTESLSINYTKNRFEDIELFPVPVRDHLNIRLNSPQSEGFFVDIFNSAGQFMMRYRVTDPQQPITLDLSNLLGGYFYARISDGYTQVTKKLFKVN